MNKIYTLLLALSSFGLFAQEPTMQNDTAHYPYWIDMMADPEVNFFQTQRAFELYWQNRPIEKGSGYKPFKRWEYSIQEIVEPDGTIPAPGSLEQRVRDYIEANRPGGPGSGGGIVYPGGVPGQGPAKCLTNGKWIEIGPYQLAGNRTSQPNGLGRINSIAFHPNDSNTFYIGAPAGGMWVTHDFGQTWSSNTDTLVTLGVSAIAINPVAPDTIYLGTGDRDASDSYGNGVIRSFDGGSTWRVSNTGMGNTIVGQMVIHPTNPAILVAATNGGIYRSTNHASNWSRTQTGNFKDIVMDPANPNILYACTYNSARFYRSTDAGLNWTEITTGLPSGKYRMAIAVTPADSNFVYVIVTNQRTFEGLYLSTDRGLSFKQMSNTPNIMDYSHLGTGTSGQAWYDLDIAADARDKSVVYVGGVNIFKSTDSGTTWKINAHWVGTGAAAIHADQHIFEIQPGTHTLFVGNDGGIYFTRNGGTTWTDISTGLGIAQIYRLGQSATDRDLLINGYQDNGTGMFEKGAWYTVMGGDGMDCAINPSDPKYAYSDLYYGDVRRYTNGSYSGKIAANGTNGINESGGWVTPFILKEGTPGTMFIGYKNVWRSTNIENASAAGVNWTKISNNLGGSNAQNILHLENSPADPEILYMSRVDNKLFRTSDASAASPTWTDLTSALPNNADVVWIETHPTNKERLWICQSNKIYQSDNGGSSWTNISSGLPNIPLLCVVFDSSSKLQGMYLGSYMGVFYRDTTMSQWIWYNEGMPVNTRVRDVEIYYDKSGRHQSHVVAATYGRGNWRSALYDEDQLPPVADFTVSRKELCANESITLEDISMRTPTRWRWSISPSTVTFVNGTDSTSAKAELGFNAKGKYTIKLVVDNCAGIDSIERIAYIDVADAITPANCSGNATNIGNYGIGILNVEIDTFSNSSQSAFEEGAYLDMVCTRIIHLKTDTAYFAQITTGKTYNENVKIYIDFNNNGDLSDAGELVFSSPKQKPTHADSIRIPQNPVTGKILRMRIMSDYDTIPDNPCHTLKYGQVEDYGVLIEPRLPEPNFFLPYDRICLGEDLPVLDSSEGTISDYFWLISNGTWSDSSFNPGHRVFSLPEPGYYSLSLYLNGRIVHKTVDSAVLVIDRPDLSLSILSGDSTGCEGRTVGLFAGDSKGLASSFDWFRGTTKLTTISSNLNLDPIALSDSGYYRVAADNMGCTDTSSAILLQVYPKPNARFTTSAAQSCLNNNLVSMNNTSGIAFGTLSYSWDFGSDGSSSLPAPSHNFSDTGTFDIRLIAVSPRACSDTAWNTVRILENPVAQFSVDLDSQCLKGNVFNFNQTSTISTGTLNTEWDFGDGMNSNTTSPSHSYGTAGSFRVQLISTSISGCKDTASTVIGVYPSISMGFTWNSDAVPLSYCLKHNLGTFRSLSSISSGNIVFREIHDGAGNSRSTDVWAAHRYSAPGSYTPYLIEESDRGCRDTSFGGIIEVLADPIALFSVNDTIQCLGNNSFNWVNSSTISTGTIANFEWDFGDGSSNFSANPPARSYAAEGDYMVRVIARSDRGCLDTAALDVSVRSSPMVDFASEPVCLGEPMIFVNGSSINQGSLQQFEWQFGDGSVSNLADPEHTYLQPGSYNVQLKTTSDEGCTDSLIRTFAVYPIPEASFTHTKERSWERETDIQFHDQSSSDVQQWAWFFEQHGVSDLQNPLITFTDTGNFMIQLVVRNANGCLDSVSNRIFIFPETQFYIPSAFSPNNDSRNDLFRVSGLSFVAEFRLTVYNRWGQIMYQSNDVNSGWDGTYLGEPVPSGNYAYVLEMKDLNGIKSSHSGFFSLLR
ncbi:MAG: PKD domain-containing protein [Flavobacteriales bacterium]|nr:PKD domain-containing protein [Flavobacteriales bacterium]